ncbi:P-loop containing nucleoside triphosphate hydrolase protein [Ilyonectria robusta]|uniref:P-loop containing nucleoside triphosphate hydrolase protein n=1 Tax=Ilyonectria robusta TaxID=1079257 RepID=UPI001E8E9F68|nr:P-loop containing nucleoside triphosphate hydrolase protein [Ilyonectria robusta]KAH8736482.1 P-loop containing nucleoside triphosphate hydrolase protein [Ilyonectria robusta]
MLFSTCSGDNSLGPTVDSCRDGFDFTIHFETLVFSLIPSALFIPISLWRTAVLSQKPAIVHARSLQLVKLVAFLPYLGLQLTLVVLVGLRSFNVTDLFISSAVLQFLAGLCMLGLSYFEHGRSPRSSLLLTGFLLLTLLLDIAETRTFWLASNLSSELRYAGIFTGVIATKAVLLAVESTNKSKWVRWDTDEPHSPEETSGIFGLGVYFWLNSLFLSGYRKILQLDDLYPLDRSLKSHSLHQRFQHHLDYEKLRRDDYGLLKVLMRTLTFPLLLPIAPRLVELGFKFCQPFFINSLLSFLSRDEDSNSSNFGYGLIGASILIYGGMALSMAVYQYLSYRCLQMVRGCLAAAIYNKLTEAQAVAGDESAALTLMSADLERIRFGFRPIHNLWASVVEVGIASWLLYNQLGLVFLAPVIVVICCSLAILVIVRHIGDSQKAWMSWVQKRVGLTASVVAKMKSVKMSGLTTPITDSIQQLRVDELAASGRFRGLTVVSSVIAFTPLLLSPVFTFAVAQRSLDSTKIFTSLSYIVLLATPLSTLFQDIPLFFSAVACVGRIQNFLASESREDFRASLLNVTIAEGNEKMANGTSQLPGSESQSDSAILIRDGRFGWEADNMVLNDINIDIPKSALTIVCGPTASGKSTLCRAILAEIPFHDGSIVFTDAISRVAYCDQEPFLSNGTIKDNIVGSAPFDRGRYSDAMHATMLDIDIKSESLPQADHKNIGSNGIVLSGGQKQRVALARALYLESDLLILDDVFSGLDNETEKQVFNRIFGPTGLTRRRKSTAILCTHSTGHLSAANHIIALGPNGTVIEQGNFESLVQSESDYIKSLSVETPTETISTPEVRTESGMEEAGHCQVSPEPTATSKLSMEEAQKRQLGDGGVYKHYFKSMGYPLAASIFTWGAVIGFSYNFPTIWLTYWSDDSSAAHPSHAFSYYIGIYALLNVGCVLCMLGLGITVFYLAVVKAGASLHSDALRTMSRATLSFFTKTDQGQIVNLFSQDMNLIDTELPNALLDSVFCVFVAIGQAAVLTTTSPYMAISYPFLVAILWFIQKYYLRTSRQLRLLDLETKTPLYTHFIDTAKGIVTLRAFGSVAEDLKKNLQLLDTSQRPAYLLVMIQNWLILVLGLVVMVIAAILTSLAVKLRASSGFTGASLVTLMSFGDQLTQIVIFLTQLETSLGAIARLRSFNATVQPEAREREDIIPPERWPQQGQIELKDVSATYSTECRQEDADTAQPSLALRNINLSVKAGERVAICGRTGSGKSSLVALLLKLLDPMPGAAQGGTISIDNTALDRVDRTTLRRRIIAVPQESVFLPDGSTFRANLDPFAAADMADCQTALEAVALWAMVSDRGGLEAAMSPDTLSIGQKQLFSLARAVVRHRVRTKHSVLGPVPAVEDTVAGGILLLDEVSSSVDGETEKMMQDVIRREFRNYTVLAVSHRLDMILDFDRVVVMDQGEMVEVGNPKTLSEQRGTRFGELWKAGGK